MISVRCLIPRLVILQNHSSLTTKKLVKPNEFGSLGHIDVPLERLTNTQRVSEYDSHRYQQKLKEIRYPVNQSRKTTQRLEKQQYLNSVSNRNILIECSQPEFNHHEGMIYPRGLDIPLCSEFWHKNKYKNHWFIVKRKTKWEDFIPDQLDVRLKDSILKLGFKMPTSTQHILVIVMAVTTSLKEQIYNVLSKISVGTPLNIKICKQGEDDKPNNWDILVGTPGLIEKYILSLEHPSEVSHVNLI
uniref:RNA helicase n=1 Tax=Heterorhabditis bacteriophora TaxID=37862 RepID=A0A1I7XEQ8_HETBA